MDRKQLHYSREDFQKEGKRKKMNCLVNEWVKGNGFSQKKIRKKKNLNCLVNEWVKGDGFSVPFGFKEE